MDHPASPSQPPSGPGVASAAAARDRRAALATVAVHLALLVAVALAAALLYGAAVSRPRPPLQPLWLGVDLALFAGAVGLVYRLRAHLGFSALDVPPGARLSKLAALGLLAALSLAAVAASQLLLPDKNGVWLDESQYLETLRRGEILRHGLAPFSVRWLVPFLAGRWNLLPFDDAFALKAVNFASLTVAAFALSLLVVRLRVALWLAALLPFFFLSSYLGTYAAGNRLVIDAFNYATYALLFHALVRPEHRRWFAALLLLACFNSEKAIAWIPIYAAVSLLRLPRPWRASALRTLGAVLLDTLRVAAPALLYLVAITLYAAPAQSELATCGANLHLLSFTSLHVTVRGSCAEATTFQKLWMPFGPFTVYALLAFVRPPDHARWLQAIPLLLLAVFLQILAATDTERMAAYAFIVYLPLGFVYLHAALGALPQRLAKVYGVALAVLAVAEQYLVPTLRAHHLHLPVNALRMTMSALEVLLVCGLIFFHHAVARPAAERHAG